MRINFNSFCLSVGGGNRVILELADGLAQRGHDVTVTHAGCSSYRRWYGVPKCKIIDLNPNRILRFFKKYYLRKQGFDYSLDSSLAGMIPDCDVNVATAFDTVYPTLFSKKGVPFYLVQHYEPFFYPDDPVKEAKAKLTYSLPLNKLCVSHWLAEKVGGQFLGNGLNFDKFKNLGLKREYDIMALVRNIKRKGDCRRVLEGLRERGFKVLVVSNVSEKQLLYCYNVSKAFLCLSNIREGFGLEPLEAMRCGAVPLMTACTEYYKHGVNSLVLLRERSFIDEAEYYLNELRNDSYRSKLVKGCAETAKQFDFNKVLDSFEDLVR